MTKLKIISLFSGIGMQEEGFKKSKIDYELVKFCEYNKKVANCFCIYHNESPEKNLGDIRNVDLDKLKDTCKHVNIIISSFPCQSFSDMGKRKGLEDESRGGMFDETWKFCNKLKPDILILENVKNIQSTQFQAVPYIKQQMKKIGYNCFDKVLNAKDFNIPQNRERWFMVCVKKTFSNKEFQFPEPTCQNKRVVDILEKDVTNRVIDNSVKKYYEPKYFRERKYDIKGSNNIYEFFNGVKQGYEKSGYIVNNIYSIHGISPTLTTSNNLHFYEIGGKLTSLERWKLMGLPKSKYKLLKSNDISDSCIDFITGNGIVVNVFAQLIKNVYDIYY